METRKVTFHGADGTALVGVLDSPPDECSQVVREMGSFISLHQSLFVTVFLLC